MNMFTGLPAAGLGMHPHKGLFPHGNLSSHVSGSCPCKWPHRIKRSTATADWNTVPQTQAGWPHQLPSKFPHPKKPTTATHMHRSGSGQLIVRRLHMGWPTCCNLHAAREGGGLRDGACGVWARCCQALLAGHLHGHMHRLQAEEGMPNILKASIAKECVIMYVQGVSGVPLKLLLE